MMMMLLLVPHVHRSKIICKFICCCWTWISFDCSKNRYIRSIRQKTIISPHEDSSLHQMDNLRCGGSGIEVVVIFFGYEMELRMIRTQS